jgi:F-type H+-transporting ATPase subunit b
MAAAPTAPGAHTTAPGGPKAPFPPFHRETFGSQLLWFAIAFGLLYVLLARVALPRVAARLEARRARIAGDLKAADQAKAESEAAIASYEKALAEARAKAQELAAETHHKLAAETEAKRKELETALSTKLADAERKIEATKIAAMREVKGIAVETAGAIVQRVAGLAPDKAAIERALDASRR